MILSAILGVLYAVVNAVIELLPEADALPAGFGDAFESLADYLSSASALFPISDFLSVVSVCVLAQVATVIVKGVLVIYKMVRG